MKVDPIGISSPTQTEAMPEKKFTAKDKRDELAREINLRKSFYPSQVRTGRMTQDKADRQIAILYEIWLEYAEKAKSEEAQQTLPIEEPSTQPQTTGGE